MMRAIAAALLLATARGQANKDCPISVIEPKIREINAACCVPASVCHGGAPKTCNSECAKVFLEFYRKCYKDLSGVMGKQVTMFDELAEKCDTHEHPNKGYCLTDNHQKQLSQYLECARTENAVARRAVCVERALVVLGLKDSQNPKNGAGMCFKANEHSELDLNLPMLSDTIDDSDHSRNARTHGDAYIADGAHFDGSGDYVSVPNFEYTKGGQFSVGVWFTKESCTGGIYEYLFSHSRVVSRDGFSTPTGNERPVNQNVHMYVGCQHSGGGWSSLGGTIIRFNLFDDAGTAVMFDYPAWNAKSFNAVTNVWIHATMVVDKRVVAVYTNGERVDDSKFGFFNNGAPGGIPYECRNNAGCNQRTGKATLSRLNKPLGTITMKTDIFLGGRNDNNKDRHFRGKLAGVTISSGPMKPAEIKCVFDAYNGLLPALPHCDAMVAEMMMGGNFELEISFLKSGGLRDGSGKNRKVTKFGGDVTIGGKGAQFDGDGDYVEIANFNYESDGDFTIAYWITKDDCRNDTPYEYLYSHVEHMTGAHTSISDTQNSNVNMYIGCEKPGGHDVPSTLTGTIMRFNLIDAKGTWALFDFYLGKGGGFDSITHVWTHVMMSVTRHSVSAYINGKLAGDHEVGFPSGQSCQDMHLKPSCEQLHKSFPCSIDMKELTGDASGQYKGQKLSQYCEKTCGTCKSGTSNTPGAAPEQLKNSAYPYPSDLRKPFEGFKLESPIFIGGRADLNKQRHFMGKLALLKIYSSPMAKTEAHCLFMAGDAELHRALEHRRLLGDESDKSDDATGGEEDDRHAAAVAPEDSHLGIHDAVRRRRLASHYDHGEGADDPDNPPEFRRRLVSEDDPHDRYSDDADHPDHPDHPDHDHPEFRRLATVVDSAHEEAEEEQQEHEAAAEELTKLFGGYAISNQ